MEADAGGEPGHRRPEFPRPQTVLLALQDREIRGVDRLASAADLLYGDADPAEIFCREEAFSMEYDLETGVRSLIISLPYADERDVRAEKEGDDLLLYVRNEVRRLRLPDILCRRDLAGWKLTDGRLILKFDYPYQRGK
jgi:arsenite-transporting ATPase